MGNGKTSRGPEAMNARQNLQAGAGSGQETT